MTSTRTNYARHRSSEQEYFEFLCSIVETSSTDPRDTHFLTLEILHDIPFEVVVRKDQTRLEDGLALRDEFLRANPHIKKWAWLRTKPCTVLEMLIALCRRAEDLVDGGGDEGARIWFWQLLDNIGCAQYVDAYFATDRVYGEIIRKQIERVVSRSYDGRGNGSLFPLRGAPTTGRRNIPNAYQRMELWYQLMNYIADNP